MTVKIQRTTFQGNSDLKQKFVKTCLKQMLLYVAGDIKIHHLFFLGTLTTYILWSYVQIIKYNGRFRLHMVAALRPVSLIQL